MCPKNKNKLQKCFSIILLLLILIPLVLFSLGLFTSFSTNEDNYNFVEVADSSIFNGSVQHEVPDSLTFNRTVQNELTDSSRFTVSDYSNSSLQIKVVDSAALNGSIQHKLLAQYQNGNQPSVKSKRFSKLERIEANLAKARSLIKEAAKNINSKTWTYEDPDYIPQGPIYKNANAFHRSYLEMEKTFKIYMYKEGEVPMFHNGPCRSIYSTEGRFIHEMEKGNIYITNNPHEAHVYFLPFSVVMMVQYLFVPGSHEIHAIGRTITDYIDLISQRHPFWNRSLGADHFMVSCHDWGPHATSYVPNLFNNSIRVLCNANTSEGFNPSKDVPLPEINLLTGEVTGLLGGPSPSRRPVLAFFAGRLHGDIRSLLLNQWKNKDEEIQVYDSLPPGTSYQSMLRTSRFCLCPSGYEVASPRVVEAIYAECIPVLISDGYIPPLSDVLNWKAFSVMVAVEDIPNIKKILMGISQTQYLRMHKRLKNVQRHFVVNGLPKRFDFFHMMVHSIWLRRLNIRIRG